MGAIARRHTARTGALPEGTLTFTLPAGYYVVAYLLESDPDQSEASRLTIAWANTHKAHIEVIASYLVDTVRFAGIRTTQDIPYPVEGKWICLATATTAQDPVGVYSECTRQNTAQYEAVINLGSDKADIANSSAQESGKLANAAAKGAIEALKEDDDSFFGLELPSWVPWVAGGAVVVGGIWGLARLIRG